MGILLLKPHLSPKKNSAHHQSLKRDIMTCLLKDFLKQFALEPGEMLEKLLNSQDQAQDLTTALKLKTQGLQASSFDLNALLLFWGGLAQNSQEEKAQDVVYHALLLHSANINDPNSQACYSAIELYKLLEKLDNLKVYLQNIENTQYRAVLIHTHDAHYIYDPIKDPRILFTEDEYATKPSKRPYLIQEPLLLAYETLKEKFLTHLELDIPAPSFKKRK